MSNIPRGVNNPPPIPPRTLPPPVSISSISSHPLMVSPTSPLSPSTSPPRTSGLETSFSNNNINNPLNNIINNNNNKNGSAPNTPRGRGTASARNSVNFSEVTGDIFHYYSFFYCSFFYFFYPIVFLFLFIFFFWILFSYFDIVYFIIFYISDFYWALLYAFLFQH